MIVFWTLFYLFGAEFTAALYEGTAQIMGKPFPKGTGVFARIAWPFLLPRLLGTIVAVKSS